MNSNGASVMNTVLMLNSSEMTKPRNMHFIPGRDVF